jgi:hypothetical protein
VYARPADGSGPDRPLAHLERMVQEVTWSPDGGWLVLRTDNTTTGAGDLVGVRTRGDATPVPLVASGFTELQPAISPDGRWLAYASNESGTNEVYVRPFPNTTDGHWQVSNGGGTAPLWAPSRRELFYLNRDGRLIAAEVQPTSTTFAVERLVPLFDASGFLGDGFHRGYEVAPDGRSFIFVSPRGGTATSMAPQIVWVDQWFTDLAARLKR